MKFGPWTGIAAAGVGAAMLLIPHSETYQSTMFYQWTDQVSDNGVVSRDPAVATPTPAPSPLAPPSPSPIVAAFGEPATNPDDAGEHDHRTVRRSPSPSGPVATLAPIRLDFDSGQGTTLQEPLVIGRNPSPVTELPTAGLLSYEDPTMSVSKTHLVIGQEAGAVWVEDLGSSNGTTVVDTAGQATVVAPRSRTAVPLGATIRFGDRWVQVRRQGVDGE